MSLLLHYNIMLRIIFLKSFGDAEPGIYSLSNSTNEVTGVSVAALGHVVSVVNADGQIFGHVALLNCLDSGSLEGLAESVELFVVVKLCSVHQASGPGEDGGDGVGGSFLSLLVFPVMPGDGSMGSFGFDGSIGSVEY